MAIIKWTKSDINSTDTLKFQGIENILVKQVSLLIQYLNILHFKIAKGNKFEHIEV